MKESVLVKKVNLSYLQNPDQGRAYLKEALAQNNEEVFLQALHNIIDSFSDSELDLTCEVR